MDKQEPIEGCLNKKKIILEKLAANTETQRRFIPKREMRGLRRILRERDVLMEELAAVNRELARYPGWKIMNSLALRLRELTLKQQEILRRAGEALQEAIMERNRIAAELNSKRTARNIKNRYVNHWLVRARGGRINEKG